MGALIGWLARGEPRSRDLVQLFVVGLGLALVGLEALWLTTTVIEPDPVWSVGMDYRYYMSLGTQWLADGTFYLPHQLAGPHQAGLLGISTPVDTLYPPVALLLFVPFTFLPAILWWAIPIGVTFYALWRLQPPTWAWIVMLVFLAWPRAIGAYLFGNTDMWAVAFIAAGAVWGWPALLVLFKPTLVPFTLIGIRRRSWWVTLAVLAGVSLLMLPLWLQYVTAMANIRGLDGLTYSLGSGPLLLIPLVAWSIHYWRKTREPDQVVSSPAALT